MDRQMDEQTDKRKINKQKDTIYTSLEYFQCRMFNYHSFKKENYDYMIQT